MSNAAAAEEKWQVEVGAQIYEADYKDLTEWIGEGALLPHDKVRRANLRWIEACKVPGLKTFFDAKAKASEPPLIVAVNDAETVFTSHSATPKEFSPATAGRFSEHSPAAFQNSVCQMHSGDAAQYFCQTCGNHFCRACPKSYGGSVKVCPLCGAMCQSLKEFRAQNASQSRLQSGLNEGFGFADLTKALAHPFQFKTSLFFGALMFAFFTVGQTAAFFGGFAMLGAALFCALGANMLTFGVLANTVEKFASGKTDANFMPDFDDFSIVDDIVHPFFLSISAYLSSFGPFILVCIVGAYLIFSSLTAQAGAVEKEIAKVPGTPAFDSQKAVDQSARVRQITESLRAQNDQRLARQNEITFGDEQFAASEFNSNAAAIEQFAAEDSRNATVEQFAGKSLEAEKRETGQIIRSFLGLAAPLVVVGFFAFLWGAFYFPAACAVAAYTRSFSATINPLVGLDTIRRLGFDYLKILLMSFAIVVAAGFAQAFLSVIFAPFELPQMGNLPLKAVGSLFNFYFFVVFSCVIGYALYKNSAKLALPRG